MVSDKQGPNWAELPRDVSFLILSRLSGIDILRSARKVCSSWSKLCKDPLLWRTIDMRYFGDKRSVRGLDLELMARRAVDRSRGQLVEIILEGSSTNELLNYIGDSSSQIKRLHIIGGHHSNGGLGRAASRLPLLEELHLSHCKFSKRSLKTVGRRCRHLKSLTLISHYSFAFYVGPEREVMFNEEAKAIAKFMHELRHLKISGNRLTNLGLRAILDGCPRLESLELRKCYNINVKGQDFLSGIPAGMEFLYDDPLCYYDPKKIICVIMMLCIMAFSLIFKIEVVWH